MKGAHSYTKTDRPQKCWKQQCSPQMMMHRLEVCIVQGNPRYPNIVIGRMMGGISPLSSIPIIQVSNESEIEKELAESS